MTTSTCTQIGLFSEPLCPKNIFWTNLILLGFNSSELAKGVYSTVTFDKDVFTKGFPNSVKAMELIVWFLFKKLDDTLTTAKFTCWPILDLPSSLQFRTVAYKWLDQLKKEGCLGNTDIVLRRSLFDECQGERFERLIMAFSNYVLKVTMDRDYQHYNRVPKIEFTELKESAPELLKGILKTHIKMQTDNFLQKTRERAICQNRWKNLADKLSRQLYEVINRNNELKKRVHEFHKAKHFNGRDNLTIEQLSFKRIKKLEGARLIWNSCLSWIQENQNYIASIEDVINDRANKYRFNGQDISLQVPEIMMNMWEKQFQEARISPRQCGKLDLISLLKLWRFALQTLNDKITNPKTIQHQDLENEENLEKEEDLENEKDLEDEKDLENEDLSSTVKKLEEHLIEQKRQIKSLSMLKNSLKIRLNEINESIKLLKID
ncbi:HAUS augmin-like complex subunit 6 N-terminus-domain-containing protein [Gigaspora rosea]|uniref:HAUS augmin-like complex subunit 6 N-terminus-domain-containing protein n=1 Tax=Gigaspora rosea TaxID=44941 RepID=A0A397VP35_9GLOM|nr:HAUS augmin-like complex subunit 6 N-terminus-domain-containing protein [Gigaspora rosea]